VVTLYFRSQCAECNPNPNRCAGCRCVSLCAVCVPVWPVCLCAVCAGVRAGVPVCAGVCRCGRCAGVPVCAGVAGVPVCHFRSQCADVPVCQCAIPPERQIVFDCCVFFEGLSHLPHSAALFFDPSLFALPSVRSLQQRPGHSSPLPLYFLIPLRCAIPPDFSDPSLYRPPQRSSRQQRPNPNHPPTRRSIF
jgi:hypothetical protein